MRGKQFKDGNNEVKTDGNEKRDHDRVKEEAPGQGAALLKAPNRLNGEIGSHHDGQRGQSDECKSDETYDLPASVADGSFKFIVEMGASPGGKVMQSQIPPLVGLRPG